jgi:transcriptional regulator with XRE-family HTH domain
MSTAISGLDRVPLSVILFHAAMERGQSLSAFADEVRVGTPSLRQLILGKTQNPRQKTLNAIGQLLNMSTDELNQRMDLRPEAKPEFKEWLKTQMAGRFNRSRLAKETKISIGALSNYLEGKTLPDSDHAGALAQTLGAPMLEVARTVVANLVVDAGGVTVPAEAEPVSAAASVDEQPLVIESVEPSIEATSTPGNTPTASYDELQLLGLWRQLHPQGRRATLSYIAMLLAER